MKILKLKNYLMLTVASIMIVFLVSVIVRVATQAILVDMASIDNKLTQLLLTGTTYGRPNEERPQKNITVNWKMKYPFLDEKKELQKHYPKTKLYGLNNTINRKIRTVDKSFSRIKKEISDWTGQKLLSYIKLVEIGRAYEVMIRWNLMNPELKLVNIGKDLSFAYGLCNVDPQAKAISSFSHYLVERKIHFLYVVAPFKIDKYGDFEINGKLDFSNQNTDSLIAHLKNDNVDILDLRDYFHTLAEENSLNYHDFFYHTDHHWRPETAIQAARVVGTKLKDFDIPVDVTHYNVDDFFVEILPSFFLGSQGRKATLAKTKPEDFHILHPKFPTKIHFTLPQRGIDTIGALDVVAYDKSKVSWTDFYNQNSYAMYGYGDMQLISMDNLFLPDTDKKILIIRDSFCDNMGIFLSLAVRNISMIDLRYFTGSLHSYIEDYKPDVVIVMYNAGVFRGEEDIDWDTHRDLFDFR